MLWARMVAYVTGMVNQELLVRNEYLGAENRILRGQIQGSTAASEGEKVTLAEIAQRLGRKALEELAAVAKPDILLAWYRKLITKKFDGSKISPTGRSTNRSAASSIRGRADGERKIPAGATIESWVPWQI